VLLLDLSGSVEAEYELIMNFSRAIVPGLNINDDRARVGVVAFCDNVSRVIVLNESIRRQNDLIEAFNFPHHRGKTNIQVTCIAFTSPKTAQDTDTVTVQMHTVQRLDST